MMLLCDETRGGVLLSVLLGVVPVKDVILVAGTEDFLMLLVTEGKSLLEV